LSQDWNQYENFADFRKQMIGRFLKKYLVDCENVDYLAPVLKHQVVVMFSGEIADSYLDCSFILKEDDPKDSKNCGHCKVYPVKCLSCLFKAAEGEASWQQDKKQYYSFEYNQRSSITKHIHEALRFKLYQSKLMDKDVLKSAVNDPEFFIFDTIEDNFADCLVDAIKKDPDGTKEIDPEPKLALGCIEHIRWNAYMRTEGYSYALNRNDLAKQHPNLLPVQYLSIQDIRKDV
jgi:hypothetical protein